MITQQQKDLFYAISLLCEDVKSEAFYFDDFDLEGKNYRIFNYRLASYTDFTKPYALECRGIMFETVAGVPVRLASRPMEKFFNYNENPFTMNLDLSKIRRIELKADGSLISTYSHKGKLKLKTKGSIFSDQCRDAYNWLMNEDVELANSLAYHTDAGWTINMEWVAPNNRIVLPYMESKLIVLNARHRETGEYMEYNTLVGNFGSERVIKTFDFTDPVEFVKSVAAMKNIEGGVALLEGGQRFKIKCDWYLTLHRAKDSIHSDRRLFEAVLDEAIDDARSLFVDDLLVLKRIDEMQEKVEKFYNHMVKIVENFYNANKTLDRKDYAIKGQNDLDRMYFGLAMNKYLGKEINYKAFMKAHYKDFGIREDDEATEQGMDGAALRKPSKKDVRKMILEGAVK